MSKKIETVIFDLGGVLIDWNPRYLYRKILKTEDEVDWFLANICTSEWNDEQDAGRSFDEAIRELIEKHPEWEEAITAWGSRWQETISGPIEQTVELLKQLKSASNHRLYALTNWSAETFPWALENFEFLGWFEGIVVSGVEKTRKPAEDFYKILLNRYNVDPATTVFIDDNIKNVEAARMLGIHAIHFKNADQLRDELTHLGVF